MKYLMFALCLSLGLFGCNGESKEKCEEDSCSGHGTCDDSGGKVVCDCETGFGGDQCDACAEGYQDNDDNGTCQPSCDNAQYNCGGHGQCDDSGGAVSCVCDQGYVGDLCDACDVGFQDNDSDGSCLPTCQTAGLECGEHGVCDDSGGQALCACDPGYAGAACDECAAGYQDNDSDGLCQPDCSNPDFNCGDHGDCDDSSGAVTCVCHPGYTGDSCTQCAEGYQDNDQDGSCQPDCTTANLNCPGHSSCNDASGQSECVCHAGYTGPDCDQCDTGYQDNDGNGTCLPDCQTAGYTCSGHGECSDVTGEAVCVCDPGYFPDGQGNCVESGTGEDCDSAMLLPILGNSGSDTGTTVGAGDNLQPGCVADDAQEVVYYFNLSEDRHARIHVYGYDTVMALRTVCEDPATELECNDDITPGQVRDSLIEMDLEAGSYYIIVDGYGGTAGDYTIEIELSCTKGQIWDPVTETCIDDPCDPNPCTEPNMNLCTPQLPASYTCDCNIGYLPDGQGGCELDPNANEWAWIVFMNADNNLEPDGYDDLNEMMQAGSNAYVHIVVLMDTSTGDGGDARKLYVTQGGADELENLGEVDMGDWQTMRDFGIWAVENFPARHYAFILWDHGDGWAKNERESPLLKGFSNDDHGSSAGISVANGDYAAALEGITQALGGKLDIVGFDACLMAMWEVAVATAPYADYLLASEETEPGAGWPYADFLVPLVNDHLQTPDELACNVVSAYYNDSSWNSTLSVTDLSTMDAVTTSVSAFADAMLSHPELYDDLSSVRMATTGFDFPSHKDLYDFAQGVVAMQSVTTDLETAANNLLAQLDTSIICSESNMGEAYGMAIYFPAWLVDSAYNSTLWSQISTWDDFLADFVGF